MVNISFIQQYALKKSIPKGSEKPIETIQKLTHLYMHNNYIEQIGNLEACRNLQVLYLHDNTIREIKNLETLHTLQNLYLQKNRIGRIEGLENLRHLKKLYLGYNRISVVEKLDGQTNLEELHVEKQALSKGEELCFDPRTMLCLENLLVLNVSQNNLTNVNALLPLRQLKVLKATHNNINDFQETAKILGCLYQLTDADFTGNPMTKLHRYRETIIANTFRLAVLDQKDINETTRDFIKRFEYEKSQHRPLRTHNREPDISGDVPPPIKKTILKNLQKNLSNTLLTTSMSEETTTYVPWKALKKSTFTAAVKTFPAKAVKKRESEEKVLERKVQFSTVFPQFST